MFWRPKPGVSQTTLLRSMRPDQRLAVAMLRYFVIVLEKHVPENWALSANFSWVKSELYILYFTIFWNNYTTCFRPFCSLDVSPFFHTTPQRPSIPILRFHRVSGVLLAVVYGAVCATGAPHPVSLWPLDEKAALEKSVVRNWGNR